MEDGTAGDQPPTDCYAWAPAGGVRAEGVNDSPHGGAACAGVLGRETSASGLSQDVSAKIASGVAYDSKVWVKLEAGPEIAMVSLYLTSTGDGQQRFSFSTSVDSASWAEVTGTLLPTWTGALIESHWHVNTGSTTADFKVDDAALIELTPGEMAPVAGTWRRDQLP